MWRKQSAVEVPLQFRNQDEDSDISTKQARLSWAALIKKVYEVDPLICPKFGAEMKIIAFITDRSVVRKILGNSTAASSRGPPKPPEPVYSYVPVDDDLPWTGSW